MAGRYGAARLAGKPMPQGAVPDVPRLLRRGDPHGEIWVKSRRPQRRRFVTAASRLSTSRSRSGLLSDRRASPIKSKSVSLSLEHAAWAHRFSVVPESLMFAHLALKLIQRSIVRPFPGAHSVYPRQVARTLNFPRSTARTHGGTWNP